MVVKPVGSEGSSSINANATFSLLEGDLHTRVSFKYSISRRISSTPTFYVNGFELLDAGSPIDFEGWKNTIDPLVNPREILEEVYAQKKEVEDEENAENIPVSTFFIARVGR
ncbi:hypothetical protein IGI04_015273 [Brassica rapa subsp. trilocularis]|uniref:Thioredoxin-like fold domain-containing protein n=1 Tax=Brassica rapa subsp. trilocularis TaxID=1813537 RepID=A0ABQ7MPK0_BRACM|nr:hypothetical protein IGI04_015273 [Brassica rapa subsp. trilocularis]